MFPSAQPYLPPSSRRDVVRLISTGKKTYFAVNKNTNVVMNTARAAEMSTYVSDHGTSGRAMKIRTRWNSSPVRRHPDRRLPHENVWHPLLRRKLMTLTYGSSVIPHN